jgi:hypothetical protein
MSINQGEALIYAHKNTSLLRIFFGVAVGNAMKMVNSSPLKLKDLQALLLFMILKKVMVNSDCTGAY